jgi:hypothetical protein
MIKRVRLERKTNSKSTSVTSAPTRRWTLFGQPPLLEGEDRAAYDELFARICAVIKPVDIIYEMLITDVVSSEWELLRWRRSKTCLIRARELSALESFLTEKLDDNLYSKDFTDRLTEILKVNLPEDEVEHAQMLARACARAEVGAVDKVNEVLAGTKTDLYSLVSDARAAKAEQLVQEFVRGKPDAVTLVNKLLTEAGASMDTLVADALADKLDDIERIDRLATIAESRRNASLHEIDRRRAVLGETLRRSVQAIEDGEFEVIETTSGKGKNAA